MLYRVKLELFEGPLDLLLHLIKKNEVDIADIPIATITDQYLAYLGMLEEMNLDIAGEFVVMAATLMYIKSRCLLPEPEGDDDEEEGDPRAQLVQQLREYQRFREVAVALGEREVLRREVYARPRGDLLEDVDYDRTPAELHDVSLGMLLDAFREVLRRALKQPVHEVSPQGLTIHDCIGPILERLRTTGATSFISVFPPEATQHRVIVTFLALLELIRLGAIRVRQTTNFGEIIITLAASSVEAAEALAGVFAGSRVRAGEA
jgi:segregation and condensation protein A